MKIAAASRYTMTFQDAVEMIWNVMNPASKPPTGRELRVAKLAVTMAYRDLANRHNWNYYKRRHIVQTEADYSTGTVAYDHTGGTYERELTLTTGTWPANAARGVVVIDDVHYPVDERKSSTVVTLDSSINPGADVAAGTSYVWYREAYPLPVDFRQMLTIIESGDGGDIPLTYLEGGSHLFNTRYDSGSTTDYPDYYTIRNSGDYQGYMEILFGRAPNTARTYDMLYTVSPPQLRTYKYSAGTVTVVANETTVTGTGTTFTDSHVGCVIRFSGNTTQEPTSDIGGVDGLENPYAAQKTILSVSSGTTATIDSVISATAAYTGVKYVISDPIDIEPIVMRTPFENLCLFHFARLTKRKDAAILEKDFELSMLYAMEQDRRVNIVESAMDDYSATNVWGQVDVTPE